MKLNSKLRLFLIRSVSLGLLTSAASAVEIQKASIDNTNALNTGAAWVGGTVPGAADVAVWDDTVTATNVAESETRTQLGGDLEWQGIKITNVLGTANENGYGVRVFNNSASTLTLGSSGIDMSAATQALLIQHRVTLAADQEWNVRNANTKGTPLGFNNGEDLALMAQGANTPLNLDTYALTLTGAGQITIASGYLISNGTINVQNLTKIQGSSTRVTTLDNTVDVNVTAGGNLLLQAFGSGASLSNNAAISVSGAGSTLNFGLSDGGGGSNNTSSGAISMATGTTLLITGGAGAFTQSGGVDFTGNVNWNYTGNTAHTNGAVVSGNLTGDGSLSFKNTNGAATGQVRLSGDNSGFTGTMTLNGASGQRALRLTSASSGSAAATWAVDANNILQVDGVSVQLGTLDGAGTVTNSHASDATTLNVGAGTFSGVISDGATATTSLVKNTSATLTLGGPNSYTGATDINDGTLVITGATQATSAITFGGGVLGLNTGSSVTAASATVDFTGQQVLVTGVTGAPSYTLLTAGSITETPTLAAGSVSGYELQVSGNQLLFVQTGGGSTYDTWAASKGLNGLPGSATDPAKNADPDKDGLNNIGEFAFNGDPLSGSDNGKVFVLTEDSDFDGDAIKELILTIAVRSGTPAFTGTPSPSANQASDGITYSVEGSLDLAGFPTTVNVVPTPVTTGLPAAGAGYEYRSFSLNGSNGLTGKGFLRAKVTSP